MLLQKQTAFHSQNHDELDHLLRTLASGRLRDAGHDDRQDFRCNAVLSDVFPMFSLSCGFAATFDFDPFDEIRLVFQTRSESRIAFGNGTIDVDPRHGSYILPADVPVTEFHPNGYCSLAVRIKPAELKKRLAALCGEDSSQPIIFSQPKISDMRFAKFVRQPLLAAAHELDALDVAFHGNLLEELKTVTLTRLLLFGSHNFSKWLASDPRAPSRLQLNLAEDYLAANWNKALDISKMTDATGVSARTILRYFHHRYGETPRDYLRRIRLSHAREMLRCRHTKTTVVAVALKCGFSSLGNFAGSYRREFGELPSETLRSGNDACLLRHDQA